MYQWKEKLIPHLNYRRPFLVNAQEFVKRPSEDGTLPIDPYTGELKYPKGPEPELLSETSEEDQHEQQEEIVEEKEVNEILLTEEERQRLKEEKEYRLANPLPDVPDASKFDKVFILPLFCKPGRHTYLIKYKDTKEYRQSYYKKKITKYEKRFYQEKNSQKTDKKFDKRKYREAKDKLKAELFLYKLDVPARVEDVP